MAKQLDIRIDRGSPVPLYHQLAEQLTSAVTDGSLQPGDPFENEIALADRLGLSRPTVRRAIQELVAQGLLLRRRGLGTTVANRQIHRRAELTSLYDDLQRDGEAPPSTTVLSLEVVHDEVSDMLRAWRGRPQAYRAVSFHDSLALVQKLTCPLLFMTSPDCLIWRSSSSFFLSAAFSSWTWRSAM